MAIGKDGTVYLTWQYCPGAGVTNRCGNSTAYMVFSKSTDGGNTWSKPKTMAAVTLTTGGCACGYEGTLPNTHEGVRNTPVIGIDNSTGPNAGSLYVAMYNWTGTYMQVQVVRSKDGGTTWSKPVPVAPSTATHDQFFPWLSVSATGVVGVSWLDRRNDPANLSYQAFAAVSTNGGATFGTNWQLTSAFSNPNNDGSGGTYMGDYTGNTWVGSTLYAAWMDTSNGITSQDVVGGLRLK
jgi:Neuraminidase (sialidase)